MEEYSQDPYPQREYRPVTITDLVSPAIAWTKVVLFRPFNLTRWLAIAFCAWLAFLGEGGGPGLNFRLPSGGSGGPGNPFADVERWVRENIDLVILVAVLLVLLGLALGVLFTWLSSRGRFMFLDNVVRNRAEIREPWNAFARQGTSLFLFRLVFGLAALLSFLALAGICLLPFITSIQAKELLPLGVFGIFLAIVAVLAWALLLGFVAMLIEDLVVPIMYVRRCLCTEAWRELFAVFAGQWTTLALYFLFKILLGIVVGLIAVVALCVTCCVSWLPYVGTVIILPLLVFNRSFSVYFMQQFHPEYALLPPNPDTPGPPPESRERR